MHMAFQDVDNLYLVMDLLNGGDLRYQICKYRRFSEEQTSKSISNYYLQTIIIELIFFTIFRIFRCMHDNKPGLSSRKRSNTSRLKT